MARAAAAAAALASPRLVCPHQRCLPHVVCAALDMRTMAAHTSAAAAAASSSSLSGVSSGSGSSDSLPAALPISECIDLSCPVCMEEYEHARVLVQRPLVAACGHTICGRCVLALAAGANQFCCPLCRTQSAVNLPINFALVSLLSAIAPPSASVAAGASLSFDVAEAGKPPVRFTLPADSSLESVIATVCKQMAPKQCSARLLSAAGQRLQACGLATFPLLVGEQSDVAAWPPVIGSHSSFASFFHALRSHFATPQQRLAATQVTVKDSTLSFGGQSIHSDNTRGARETHVAGLLTCVCVCVCVWRHRLR